MSTESKSRVGLVREVIETVLLLGACGWLTWQGRMVLSHEKELSAHATMLNVNSDRIHELESRGSRSLESHEKMDEQRVIDLSRRVEKLEQAIISLSPVPTKLEYMVESQKRIEKLIEDHVSKP